MEEEDDTDVEISTGDDNPSDPEPEKRLKRSQPFSQTLRQSIMEYVQSEHISNPNQTLANLIKNFNEDVTAKIMWEGEFGLNYLGLDFLKTLLKNLEKLNLAQQLELLNLLKTVKFNISLVPHYYYAQIDVFIGELIKYIRKNLVNSNKNIIRLCQLLKYQLALDLPLRPSLEILEKWVSNLTEDELKSWSWNSLSFLSSILRKKNLRSILRYQFIFKERLFEVVEKKLALQEENESLESLCLIFQIFLDFSTAYRLFSKKSKSINRLIDKILERKEDITIFGGVCLFRSFLLMNFVYKEDLLLEKIEKSMIKWHFREEKLNMIMNFGHYVRQLRNETFREFKFRIGKDIGEIIFQRMRNVPQKYYCQNIWKYCNYFPLSYDNNTYYASFYEQLLQVSIDRGNHAYLLQIIKAYSDGGGEYCKLLLQNLHFYSAEKESLSLKQKFILVKLVKDEFSSVSPKFDRFSEILLQDIKAKLQTIFYPKLLQILVNEAFLGTNLFNKNSCHLRKILLERLGEIWHMLQFPAGFLLSISRNVFKDEEMVEKFIDLRLNERITVKFLNRFLSQFTTMSSSTKPQLNLLKKILRKCDIKVIKYNKETLFGLLGEINLLSIYENNGEKNKDLLEITEIMNNPDIIVDTYNETNWRIFKTYLVFLLFNGFPRRAAMQMLYKYFDGKYEKFFVETNFEEKFKIFTELCSLLSLGSHAVQTEDREKELVETLKKNLIKFSDVFYSFLNENVRQSFEKEIIQIYMLNSLLTILILMRQQNLENGRENPDIWRFLLHDVNFFFFFK